jgi:hypothetical protein
VRVRERGDRARLALEARAAFRVGAQLSGKNLDRDRASEGEAPGLP